MEPFEMLIKSVLINAAKMELKNQIPITMVRPYKANEMLWSALKVALLLLSNVLNSLSKWIGNWFSFLNENNRRYINAARMLIKYMVHTFQSKSGMNRIHWSVCSFKSRTLYIWICLKETELEVMIHFCG